jgi:hypothetical protein
MEDIKMDLKNKAIASLVCGVLAVISVFTGVFALAGLIIGIVGIILSVNIRKELQAIGDNVETDPGLKEVKNMSMAGLICSIIGTAIAGIGFLCAACIVGTIGIAACSQAM